MAKADQVVPKKTCMEIVYEAYKGFLFRESRKPVKIMMHYFLFQKIDAAMRAQHKAEFDQADRKFEEKYENQKKILEQALEDLDEFDSNKRIFIEEFDQQLNTREIQYLLRDLKPEKSKLTHLYHMEIKIDNSLNREEVKLE